MKTKRISQENLLREKFFLLMIAPVLMGMMITFITIANADWDQKDDARPFSSPTQQGWEPYNYTGDEPRLIQE